MADGILVSLINYLLKAGETSDAKTFVVELAHKLPKHEDVLMTIAEQLEVTVRSIYRDIAALQGMRVPIEGGRGIGYILRPGFTMPPLMLSIDETEATVVALALLERTGDKGLKQAARQVNSPLYGVVPLPLAGRSGTH